MSELIAAAAAAALTGGGRPGGGLPPGGCWLACAEDGMAFFELFYVHIIHMIFEWFMLFQSLH